MTQKKSSIAIQIMAGHKPQQDTSDSEESQLACADDILSAIKQEDSQALVDALTAFLDVSRSAE